MSRTRTQEIPKKLATTTVINTYPTILKFPNTVEEIDLGHFINIPIPIRERNPKPEYTDVDYKPWLAIEKFRRIEQEILHGTKPKSDIRKLKDATVKENELIDYREIPQYQHGSSDLIWEKDHRGIWIQNQRVQKSDVFWGRKKDGRHIEPKQIWYTKTNKKRIIPTREILDDDYGKNKERNDIIENIRDKFLRGYKTGRGNYENLGTYFYKSRYHKELFLEIIQALGLVNKAEPKKSTVAITSNEYDKWYMSNRYEEDEL
jgi:hypothetical protein